MRTSVAIWLVTAVLVLGGGCDWRPGQRRDAALRRAAWAGDLWGVQEWIARGASVNGVDREGNTPLHEAATGGHVEVASLLICSGAHIDRRNQEGLTPVMLALRENKKHFVEHLVQHGAYVSLHVAAYLNDLDRMADLISSGADVSAPGPDGWTPLHFAVYYRYPEAAHTLIAAGADLEAQVEGEDWWKSSVRGTPLHFAVHRDYPDLVELLVKAGAEPDTRTKRGEPTLHLAVRDGKTDILRLLLANGADPDVIGDQDYYYGGGSALGQAVYTGRLNLVKMLLECGAEANISDETGQTPLHVAITNDYPLLPEEITSHDQPLKERERSRSEHRRRSIQLAREVTALLLAHDADPGAADEDGVTPLHLASHDGLTEVMELLVDAGADVNARASGTLTPYGVIYRREIGYALSSGMTPLHVAVAGVEPDAVDLLLKHGADVSVTTEGGHTPLHYASALGSTRCMEMLLAAGADVNVQDDDGGTPLVHALLTGETEAAGILIAAGAQRADLMAYTRRATHLPSSARGLLHRALSARTGKSGSHIGDLGWARLLLDSGADPDERNDSGRTPLHVAADWQMPEFVSLLIDRGAQVDSRDMGRTTPLLYAASGGDPNLVLLLLDRGADVNARDIDGDRPLHNAARGGHVEIVRLLLARGADIAVWNGRDRTPRDEAVRGGDKELIRLLTDADRSRTGASSGDFGGGR